MQFSKIEWTEVTWNPTTGCNKVSDGCKNCYAEAFSRRLKGMGIDKYKNGFKLTLHPDVIDFPKKLKKPHKIFVNSMSDLFHEKVPLEFIQQVFKVMNECPQHIFQVLTKRAERLEELSPFLNWSDKIWMGVSVENEKVQNRILHLANTQARIKFLSLEPLLGSLPNLNLNKIDWVIVGGESGTKSRKIEKSWVEEIHKQCVKNNVAFFFKQWGGMNKKANGRELNGKTYSEMPNVA